MALSPMQVQVRDALQASPSAMIDAPGAVAAGVALVIGSDPDAILLIRRAERDGDPWSGHIGLPGGRKDRDDPDLITTALREAREEVGLVLGREALLGQLDDVAPRSLPPPGILVRPYVFAVEGRPALTPNAEVAGLLWADLDHLRNRSSWSEIELTLGGEQRRFPAYRIAGTTVWGMTERILTRLLSLL